MKLAAIDIGTNSTRLLAVAIDNAQRAVVVLNDLEITRLGDKMVDGYLNEESMKRTALQVKQFIKQAKGISIDDVVVVATKAVRSAKNKDAFLSMVKQYAGANVIVLSGEEEAKLSYLGVCLGLRGIDKKIKEKERVVVADVGGGSTEISWEEDKSLKRFSMDVGALISTQKKHTQEYIDAELEPILKKVQKPVRLVMVGGTASTIALMIQGVGTYSPEKIHGFEIFDYQLEQILNILNNSSHEELSKMPGLDSSRADIILAGVRIISSIVRGLGVKSFTVSETGLLWGVLVKRVKHVENVSMISYLKKHLLR